MLSAKKKWFSVYYKEAVFIAALIALINLSIYQTNAMGGNKGMNESISGDYLSGRFAKNAGNLEEASKHYKNALVKDPGNYTILHETYELMLLSGETEKAVSLVKNFPEESGSSPLPVMLLVLDAAYNKDFRKMVDILTPVYDKKKEKTNEFTIIVAPSLLMWAKIGLGKYDEAMEIIAGMESMHTAQFLTYQEAMLNSVMALDDKKYEIIAESNFDGLLITRQPYRIISKAVDFYKTIGKEEKATKVLDDFIKKNPSFKSYMSDRVSAQKYNKKDLIRKNIAEVLLDIGDLLYNNDKFDNAVLYLRMADYLDSDSNYIKVMLATVLEKREQYEEAIEVYNSVHENSIFYWKSKINAAIAHDRKGDTERAKNMLLELSEQRPQDYEALLNLADFLVSKKQFNEAKDSYTKVLEIKKDSSEADWAIYYARGICYERLDNWEKAEEDFFNALDISPNQPDVLNYLGYGWLTMDKNLEKAEEMLKTAVILRPSDAYIMDSYGWALYKLGRYNDAVKFLEKANLMVPYDPTTNDHLGDIYWRTGRKTEAKYQWERALGFKPEPAEVEYIKSKLENGLPPVAMVETSSSAQTEN